MVQNVNLFQSFHCIIYNGSLFVDEKKKYLKTYLDNFAYKVADNQMADYLDDNLFETDEDQFLDFDKQVS